jgi:NADH:ubiquinone oxidoreductase subunit 5 (subunit L)/multisubunit Na+/H+ antiporter MnhA subunit
MKVFTISQFGDFPFLIAMFLLASRSGTTAIPEVLGNIPRMAHEYLVADWQCLPHVLTVIGFGLTIAIFLKAAQFVFYPWLLDAMEAPVPISAQLHSSTLVVIGFYLFYRFYPIFLFAPSLNTFIL